MRDIADETKKLGDQHFKIHDTLYSNIENLRSSLGAIGPTLRGVVPCGTESGRKLGQDFLLLSSIVMVIFNSKEGC